jgi:hypothetical protein
LKKEGVVNLFKTLERLFVAVVYAESGDSEMAESIVTEHKRNTKVSNRQKSKTANKRPQLRA